MGILNIIIKMLSEISHGCGQFILGPLSYEINAVLLFALF